MEDKEGSSLMKGDYIIHAILVNGKPELKVNNINNLSEQLDDNENLIRVAELDCGTRVLCKDIMRYI